MLGDRIYVMTVRPGRITEEVVVSLPRPGTPAVQDSSEFARLRRRIHESIREESLRTLERVHA